MTYSGHPDQHFGYTSYAQHGDDFMVLNLFKLLGIPKPSYLDLGAHHPTNISNTRLLYERGSRGVNVEANPNLIEAFRKERPEDRNINVGVGPVAGQASFFMYSDSSGRNTFSRAEMESMRGLMTVSKEMVLPIVTLTTILNDYFGTFPDFISCDIEGLDFDVLSSANLTLGSVVCVETRVQETARMTAMMDRKGYFLYCRMGENLFFVRSILKARVY